MTAIVVAENLGRWYGQVAGLNEVSLSIAGGITGLVGINGAGKSTLIKLLVGEIRPSRGSIRVLGREPFANRSYFRKIGFCPQQDALYDELTGFGLVTFLLRLSGFSRSQARRSAKETLQRVGMADAMPPDRRVLQGYAPTSQDRPGDCAPTGTFDLRRAAQRARFGRQTRHSGTAHRAGRLRGACPGLQSCVARN